MAYTIQDPAALTALNIMRGLGKDSDKIQQQISSELRIQTAADDATYWSYAQTLRTDGSSLKTIDDALGLGAAKVDTTYTTMDSLIDLVSNIKATLVSAADPANDRDKLNTTLQQYLSQLQSGVTGTSFSGENWLYNNNSVIPDTRSVIGGYIRGANGQFYPQNISFPSSSLVMIDTRDASKGLLTKDIDPGTGSGNQYFLLNANSTTPATGSQISLSDSTTPQNLADMQAVVEKVLSGLNTTAAGLGIMKNQVDARSDYVNKMMDSLDTTVGALVDTDMDEASTRQTAIQAQLNIATEAMNILNNSAGNILILLE
ncbi:flagellin [Rhizobium sp. BE258]|uniref:flagellin N-terminal helical domain-containing protein n=1 Tax=Rhizobium sp. BE258 TaxID=2817722 RepID=UPI000DDBEB8D|nr:flagellin [Rhizobium sp. BE258]MDR7143349.1 flagellin [Rhizobium sp. BE258]